MPSRGHRLCIYEPRYAVAGVAVGEHAVFGTMSAIEFATHYADAEDAVRARLVEGPRKVVASAATRKVETQWQLGQCVGCGEPIRGGAVVETHAGKWHRDCFKCKGCCLALAGVQQKREEAGSPYCMPCWVKRFAPECHGCGKKHILGNDFAVAMADCTF